ncbi:CAP domain-containing protein [Bacillus pinisoli]|uniref:CAP domain-containing protein n=1 Tax=Bacillus pinisoli TaxID=2901866 RepID=UPI003AEFCDDE
MNNDTFIEHDLENPGANISADVTTISSNKYPHTKAVLIQEAKFKYVNAGDQAANKGQGQPKNTNAIYGALQNIQKAQGMQPGTQQGQQAKQQQAGNQNKATAQQQQQQAANQKQTTQQQAQAGNKATPSQQQPTAKNNATAQNQQQAQAQQQQQQKQPAATQNKTAQAAPTTAVSNFESKVIELTNAERRKNGLKDLTADTKLSDVAREKSNDMQKNNYFSHTSPTYGSPFDMMRDFGVTYNTAGENIAQGQRSPEEVVKAWMNSEGHRKNILSDKFTHIGVGYNESGHHWTQMFVGR